MKIENDIFTIDPSDLNSLSEEAKAAQLWEAQQRNITVEAMTGGLLTDWVKANKLAASGRALQAAVDALKNAYAADPTVLASISATLTAQTSGVKIAQ
jgi:hypothetical protein